MMVSVHKSFAALSWKDGCTMAG